MHSVDFSPHSSLRITNIYSSDKGESAGSGNWRQSPGVTESCIKELCSERQELWIMRQQRALEYWEPSKYISPKWRQENAMRRWLLVGIYYHGEFFFFSFSIYRVWLPLSPSPTFRWEADERWQGTFRKVQEVHY